jgi:hypothetical protein
LIFSKDFLKAASMEVKCSLLAYEVYGELIGAKKLRIMEPLNDKLIKYYTSQGSFEFVDSKKGNPHYLVRNL